MMKAHISLTGLCVAVALFVAGVAMHEAARGEFLTVAAHIFAETGLI